MKTRLALPALALAAALSAGAAWACSCVGYSSAETQLAETPLMFVGRAVRTVPEGAVPEPALGLGPGPGPAVGNRVTRFEVQRTLKGRAHTIRRIAHNNSDDAGCGVTFNPGQTYVVMARASEGRLTTNSCSQPQFPLADYERALARR